MEPPSVDRGHVPLAPSPPAALSRDGTVSGHDSKDHIPGWRSDELWEALVPKNGMKQNYHIGARRLTLPPCDWPLRKTTYILEWVTIYLGPGLAASDKNT